MYLWQFKLIYQFAVSLFTVKCIMNSICVWSVVVYYKVI